MALMVLQVRRVRLALRVRLVHKVRQVPMALMVLQVRRVRLALRVRLVHKVRQVPMALMVLLARPVSLVKELKFRQLWHSYIRLLLEKLDPMTILPVRSICLSTMKYN